MARDSVDELIKAGEMREEDCYGDPRYQDLFDTLVPMLRNYNKFLSYHTFEDHPAYKAIVGLGRRVTVLLLEELERNGGWEWIAALGDITKEEPFGEDASGYYDKQRDAWLKWGREKGFDKVYKGLGARFEHNPYPTSSDNEGGKHPPEYSNE